VPIVPFTVAENADDTGEAVFTFPDVPYGEIWSGTTTIPNADSTVISIVTASGLLLGSMQGAGSYGPWTCDHSQRLAITSIGLTPGLQYIAVWHADTKGKEFSTYPAPITTAVAGSINVPQPLDVTGSVEVGNFPSTVDVTGTVDVGNFPAISGTVDVANFPATYEVTGTVQLQRASGVNSGQQTMTGAPVQLSNYPATQGVVLSAPHTNVNPITIGPGAAGIGLILEPSTMTPLLPVANSSVLWATGSSPDVLSYLVT